MYFVSKNDFFFKIHIHSAKLMMVVKKNCGINIFMMNDLCTYASLVTFTAYSTTVLRYYYLSLK